MKRLLTRRHFMKRSGSTLAALSFLPRVRGEAAPQSKTSTVRWAQGWLLWRNFNKRPISLLEALDDLHELGADGIEFSPREGELKEQGLTVESLQQALMERGLAISGNYFSGPFYDRNQEEEIFEAAQRRINFLKQFGAKNLVIGPPRVPAGVTDRIDLIKRQAPVLDRLGKWALDQGIDIGIHPHLNTSIETPDEIDLIMEITDPRYVYLAADTGHIHLAGGDVVAILGRYRQRLNYFHFKDGVRPVKEGDFLPNLRELGRGDVDFLAVVRFLNEIHYSGWINIELDFTRTTPRESSRISMSYVDSRLKPLLASQSKAAVSGEDRA